MTTLDTSGFDTFFNAVRQRQREKYENALLSELLSSDSPETVLAKEPPKPGHGIFGQVLNTFNPGGEFTGESPLRKGMQATLLARKMEDPITRQKRETELKQMLLGLQFDEAALNSLLADDEEDFSQPAIGTEPTRSGQSRLGDTLAGIGKTAASFVPFMASGGLIPPALGPEPVSRSEQERARIEQSANSVTADTSGDYVDLRTGGQANRPGPDSPEGRWTVPSVIGPLMDRWGNRSPRVSAITGKPLGQTYEHPEIPPPQSVMQETLAPQGAVRPSKAKLRLPKAGKTDHQYALVEDSTGTRSVVEFEAGKMGELSKQVKESGGRVVSVGGTGLYDREKMTEGQKMTNERLTEKEKNEEAYRQKVLGYKERELKSKETTAKSNIELAEKKLALEEKKAMATAKTAADRLAVEARYKDKNLLLAKAKEYGDLAVAARAAFQNEDAEKWEQAMQEALKQFDDTESSDNPKAQDDTQWQYAVNPQTKQRIRTKDGGQTWEIVQ